MTEHQEAKVLIAEIEKHFWKDYKDEPYLLRFERMGKMYTCVSLDWDWWQQLRKEVGL